MPTDSELVEAACNGKLSAFDELVNRYHNIVYSQAYRRTGDSYLAQDISQEVFIKAYLNLHKLIDPTKIRSWLYSITNYTCIDWYRKQMQNHIKPLDDITEIPEPKTLEEKILQLECQDYVLRALNSLSKGNRLTTILYYIKGYSTKDISDYLDVSVKTIESRLYRSKQQLAYELLGTVEGSLSQKKLGKDFTSRCHQVIELLRGQKMDDFNDPIESFFVISPPINLRFTGMLNSLNIVQDKTSKRGKSLLITADPQIKETKLILDIPTISAPPVVLFEFSLRVDNYQGSNFYILEPGGWKTPGIRFSVFKDT